MFDKISQKCLDNFFALVDHESFKAFVVFKGLYPLQLTFGTGYIELVAG